MTLETISTRVLFIASSNQTSLPQLLNARLNHFCVDSVTPVTGDAPAGLEAGWNVLRVESDAPVEVTPTGVNRTITLPGMTQHLHYTSEAQRQELARSRPELAPSDETVAVLIPIRKSAAWWNLAQDYRYSHFQPNKQHDGHTTIGSRYKDRIYRKLYHSRYLSPPVAHDFLTYFEFHRDYMDDFRMLLQALRDTSLNPEWEYVELEYEIWMTKIG